MPAPVQNDPLADITQEPNLDQLLKEFERSGVTAQYQTNLNEETRLCEWSGQSDDGRKHREKIGGDPFPWEGASDMRPFLTDFYQRFLVAACMAAFERGQLKADPTEAGDTELAGKIQQVIQFYRKKLRHQLRTEAELCLNYMTTSGAGVWQTSWEKKTSCVDKEVDMEMLVVLAAQQPESPIADLAEVILDPEQEDSAIELAMSLVPELDSKPAARRAVRELREQGSTKIPHRFTIYNGPCVSGLRPAHEVLFPPETADIARARVIFRRDWMSETELREKIYTDGWNKAWVDAVLSTTGHTSSWSSTDWLMQGAKREWTQYSSIETQENLVEVLWAYTRQVDDKGCPRIYLTVFNPHLTKHQEQGDQQLYATHAPLDEALGEYLFNEAVTERLTRRITAARGVPDITHTWQNEEKTQRDMLADRASIEINPPRKVGKNLSQIRELRPGAQVVASGSSQSNTLEPIEPAKGSPQLAFEIIRVARQKAAEYYGVPSPDVLPEMQQLMLEWLVTGWLVSCERMFSNMARLVMNPTVITDEELFRITAVPFQPGERTLENAARGLDFTIRFDVRDLDPEFMSKKFEVVSQIVQQLDRAGRFDHFKLVEMLVNNVDPSIAQSLQTDQREAAEKVRADVDEQIGRMYIGNEAAYVENDPTAGMKLQFAHEILMANPKYMEAMHTDDQFKDLVGNYLKNLQQSVVQLGENITTGRTGVKQLQ